MTDTWPPERIERELAICEAATPGEWLAYVYANSDCWSVESLHGLLVANCGAKENRYSGANAAFIATARTSLPSALREIERLRGALKLLKAAFAATPESSKNS